MEEETVRRTTLAKEEYLAKTTLHTIITKIYGTERPHWFVQLNYHLSSFIATLALIWQGMTYLILANPSFLKNHKSIDVPAIVEKRGIELGFAKNTFYDTMLQFSLTGSILWLLLLVTLIFVWRQKSFAVYLITGIILTYFITLMTMMGWTYFDQDTTIFDKITLVIILGLTILQQLFVKPKKLTTEDSEPVAEQ